MRSVCDALLDQQVFAASQHHQERGAVRSRVRPAVHGRRRCLPAQARGNGVAMAAGLQSPFLEWKKALRAATALALAHRKSTLPALRTSSCACSTSGRTHRRAFWCEHCQKLYGGLAQAPARAYSPRRAKKARAGEEGGEKALEKGRAARRMNSPPGNSVGINRPGP
jgi:endonuclease-8